MLWGAVVVAAGSGSRFGRPKQLVELAGAPMLSWSLRTLAHMAEIAEIVIATEPDCVEPIAAMAAQTAPEKPVRVVPGGATRQASARAGLDALSERIEAVLIHDGARPLVRASDVRRGMNAVSEGRAALLAVPVVDTIKVVDAAKGTVLRTLDRDELWAAQTPQFALLRDMRRAHLDAARNTGASTDDATLLERAGMDVHIVSGSPDNFKITIPEDLLRAEQLLRERIDHLPGEEEVLLVEIFTDENLIDAVCAEIEARDGTVDGVERDLPNGVAIRAYVKAAAFEGFGGRFEAVGRGEMTFTSRFSHFAGRTERA